MGQWIDPARFDGSVIDTPTECSSRRGSSSLPRVWGSTGNWPCVRILSKVKRGSSLSVTRRSVSLVG